MDKRYMTDADRDNIVLMREKGLTQEDIARVLGRTTNSIKNVLNVYRMVKDGDIAEAKRYTISRSVSTTYSWALKRLGVPEQEPEPEAIDAPTHSGNRRNQPAEKQKTEADTDLEAAIFTASRLIIEKQHDEIAELSNSLCAKLDRLATIIQSCSMDRTQKANANADNLYREVQCIKSHVEQIRSQTKKKK